MCLQYHLKKAFFAWCFILMYFFFLFVSQYLNRNHLSSLGLYCFPLITYLAAFDTTKMDLF